MSGTILQFLLFFLLSRHGNTNIGPFFGSSRFPNSATSTTRFPSSVSLERSLSRPFSTRSDPALSPARPFPLLSALLIDRKAPSPSLHVELKRLTARLPHMEERPSPPHRRLFPFAPELSSKFLTRYPLSLQPSMWRLPYLSALRPLPFAVPALRNSDIPPGTSRFSACVLSNPFLLFVLIHHAIKFSGFFFPPHEPRLAL